MLKIFFAYLGYFIFSLNCEKSSPSWLTMGGRGEEGVGRWKGVGRIEGGGGALTMKTWVEIQMSNRLTGHGPGEWFWQKIKIEIQERPFNQANNAVVAL